MAIYIPENDEVVELQEQLQEYEETIEHAIKQLRHSNCPYAIAELAWLERSLIEAEKWKRREIKDI